MRLLLTLLFTLPLAAETCEVFTLRDGRQLVGSYDAEHQHLRLAGPIAAGIRVTPETILKRRPATTEEIPAAEVPADPVKARTSRIAWLRTGIRGLDDAMQERTNHRTIIERRLATAHSDLAVARQNEQAIASELTAVIQERQRIQAMLDEVEQARALTELRVVSITADQRHDGTTKSSSLTITELTTELTTASQRLTVLRSQLAACDGTLVGRRSALADAQDDATHLARSITEDETRLTRYTKADAEATAESRRLHALLDGLIAEGSVP